MLEFTKKYRSLIFLTFLCLMIVFIIYYVANSYVLHGNSIPIISDVYDNEIARTILILLIITCFIYSIVRDIRRKNRK